MLINAPALTNANTLTRDEAYEYAMKQLKQRGLDVEAQIEVIEVITPSVIKERFHAFRGALYGNASHTKKSAFMRPRNRHTHYKNVYFVGGTVHPGGGSPLAVMGGYNVAKRLLIENRKELGR